MNFNDHSALKGQHALLSPSQPHWINYDDERLVRKYTRAMAQQKGTRMHALAEELILLGIKLPDSRKTFNLYVNDGIGYGMTPEVLLYYSDYCFGTADTISFKKKFLRIHDYKSGETPATMKQLYVYAALFCLEYNEDPKKLKGIELRLYQSDAVVCDEPDPIDIIEVMDTIIDSDKRLEQLRLEE